MVENSPRTDRVSMGGGGGGKNETTSIRPSREIEEAEDTSREKFAKTDTISQNMAGVGGGGKLQH